MFRYSYFNDAWSGTCLDTVTSVMPGLDMLRYSYFSDAWSGTCLDTVTSVMPGLGHV